MSEGTSTGTDRVDAFTDAVLAIILTLMAVEIAPPTAESVEALGLWGAVLEEWPNFLGFVLSFLLVGQVWLNHHGMWRWIERVDKQLIMIHFFHLMFISLVPFASTLLAEHLTGQSSLAQTGGAIYAGVVLISAIFYTLSWLYVRWRGLTVPELDAGLARKMTWWYASSVPLYVVAFGLAFVSHWLSLGVYFLLIIYFMVPGPGEPGPTKAA